MQIKMRRNVHRLIKTALSLQHGCQLGPIPTEVVDQINLSIDQREVWMADMIQSSELAQTPGA